MAAANNWVRVFNLLFPFLDRSDKPTYYSGPRFIGKIREVDSSFPNYTQLMDERNRLRRSTTRKDYFYETLHDLGDDRRLKVLHLILDEIEPQEPALVADLRAILAAVPG
jgi:hypothetical protein